MNEANAKIKSGYITLLVFADIAISLSKARRVGLFGKALRGLLCIAGIVCFSAWIPSTTLSGPDQVEYAVYLTQLSDFDLRANSFDASFWMSISSKDKKRRLFSELEFPNATEQRVTTYERDELKGVHWQSTKASRIFRHDWDISRYIHLPSKFCQSTLNPPSPSATCRSASTNSSNDQGMKLDGWQIQQVRIVLKTKVYSGNFSDPRSSSGTANEFAQIAIEITLQQTDVSGFLTMAITPVAVMFITLPSYFLASEQPPLLIVWLIMMLTSSVFGAVLSMRATASELGSITLINLVMSLTSLR